jgi:hypothetical protein
MVLDGDVMPRETPETALGKVYQRLHGAAAESGTPEKVLANGGVQ